MSSTTTAIRRAQVLATSYCAPAGLSDVQQVEEPASAVQDDESGDNDSQGGPISQPCCAEGQNRNSQFVSRYQVDEKVIEGSTWPTSSWSTRPMGRTPWRPRPGRHEGAAVIARDHHEHDRSVEIDNSSADFGAVSS